MIRALRFEEVDRVPTERDDVTGPAWTPGPAERAGGAPGGTKGRRTDAWGCVWESGEDGVKGEVKSPPLAESWSALARYEPPWEVIDRAGFSRVNASCAATEKFVIPMWEPMPNLFERMQHLRGTEQLFLDLALGAPEVLQLRDKVHEFFLRLLKIWVDTDVDGIHLADDWGSQTALLVSPAVWRRVFKPCYKEYCDLAHARGKYVLMHSDGFILEILPDLIEIGVDAINAQIFCMGVERLAERFRGRICFWGEIDRQRLLTRGSVAEVRAAVRRVARAFMPERKTGVVGQCFNGKGHKLENMEAVYDEWRKV